MRSVALRALSLIWVGQLLSWARAACAEPLPVDLAWAAPPECPTQGEVMAELARITRVKPGRVVTRIAAQATIEHTSDGRYHLDLRTQRDDQTGDTELDAATCPVLKRGVTLVLALALGDGVDLVDEKSTPPAVVDAAPPESSPPPPPPAAKTNEARRARPPQRATESSLRWAPWLAASSAWGLLAKPSFGPQIGLEFGQLRWQALAEATYLPSVSADRVQGIASSYSAFVGALGVCARAPSAGWSFAACASFRIGVVHGKSDGAYQDGSATAPWYAVGPSLLVSAPLSESLKLRMAGGFDVAFDPPRFAIRGFQDVYVVSRVVPTLSLGLSL